MVSAGERVAFVGVLRDHAAGAEWEEATGWFGAAQQLVRCGGGAACIYEGIADCGDCFVEVKCVLQWKVVWKGRECGNGELPEC